MVTTTHSKWGVRLGTLGLWALAGASVVFWGLRLAAQPAGIPVPPVAQSPLAPDAQALARLLGAQPPAPGMVSTAPVASAGSRFALIGVLSGRRSGGGAALIAVDGKPPKPYRVGAEVDEGLVLMALDPRRAQLGPSLDGPASLTLEMPPKN